MIEFLSTNRELILLFIALIGISVTLWTFWLNLKQKRLENTFKVLDFLRNHITNEQIDTFIKLFHANNPLGVPPLEFHFDDGRKDHVDNMFAEGGCGNGHIHNMIELFNLVCMNLNQGDLVDEIIWYEYGQIMTKCYEWTSYIEKDGPHVQFYKKQIKFSKGEPLWQRFKYWRFLNPYIDTRYSFFHHFNRYMKRQSKNYRKRAVKHYTYVE